MKKAAFCTLGCKVNQYETDAMEELFAAAGYTIVPFKDTADVYIVNTCTVTHLADKKSRQMLHRAKKQNPCGLVVAVGCYVQSGEEALAKDSTVDLLVGNNKKSEIVALVEDALKQKSEHAAVIDINHTHTYETLQICRTSEHTRAYIKIQDGCNQFCSYCIIPYARGRVRSRDAEDILAEVRRLAAHGYKEIVLTGIHISSYGLDFLGKEYNQNTADDHLITLIEDIAGVDGLERIRLGSLEPRIITEDFVKRLSAIGKVCPHFHLSLQSGCDETLQRMNRKYTTQAYARSCALLRTWFKDPAITTDVIVGFPGETQEEFAQSLNFVQKVALAQMHVFTYSKREGTRAAKMPDQIDKTTQSRRSELMLAASAGLWNDFLKCWESREAEVLIEEPAVIDGQKYMTGHTKEYIRVAIPGEIEENTVVKCKISLKKWEDFVICERID